MSKYILGVDLGTSACKTVIFTLEGDKISDSSKEYPIYHPQSGWAEQKPMEWWNAVGITIKNSLRKVDIESKDIVGLSIDSQREAIVPIGKDGKELYNSIIWLDTRTGPQVKEIKEKISQEEVLTTTGVGIDPIYSASKILWLKKNKNRIFEDTLCFLCAKDYIVYKLTGELVTDYSMASRTMLFNVRKRIWSDEICSVIGIPIDNLPSIKESTVVIGEVSSEAMKKTLLPKGLPIVNGGGDRPCECLGAGITQVGSANIGTGTGTLVEVPLTQPSIDLRGRIPCCCHVIPNMWEYEAMIGTTGASFRWFRNIFGYEENSMARQTGGDPYAFLTQKALKVKSGSNGLYFYPYLAGSFTPKFNPKIHGVFFGISISHKKGHFVRAILEGVAFQYLDTLELLKELDVHINIANMVGGETRSDLWNQIKADVSGKQIRIPKVEDAAALGAALLAGVGTKQYPSLNKAARETVKIGKIFTPNPESQQSYSTVYRKYKKVYNLIEKAYENIDY